MKHLDEMVQYKYKPEAFDSTNRPVVDIEYEYDDGMAYIISATYLDNMEDVSDAELEYLTNSYPEMCDEAAFEHSIGAAEDYYEGDR